MSSTIGDTLRLTLFGRSHGPVIGMTLAGIPAGKALSPAALQAFLDRRAPGRSPLSTARREADIPRFLSGLNGGVTTGEDITAVIENTDVRSADYELLSAVPRPGHADYTAYVKYGRIEPGGGPFSGRMTAALCIAGGICLQLLEQAGISVLSRIRSIGPVNDRGQLLSSTADKPFPVVDEAQGEAMAQAILEAKAAGDSLGGVIECRILGVPAGVVGSTVVAVGTSLPELVTTVKAVARRESSLSVGNIVGANIIDLALILPACAAVSGGSLLIGPQTTGLDLPACLVLCGAAVVPPLLTGRFHRWQGAALLGLYAGYLRLLFG